MALRIARLTVIKPDLKLKESKRLFERIFYKNSDFPAKCDRFAGAPNLDKNTQNVIVASVLCNRHLDNSFIRE